MNFKDIVYAVICLTFFILFINGATDFIQGCYKLDLGQSSGGIASLIVCKLLSSAIPDKSEEVGE